MMREDLWQLRKFDISQSAAKFLPQQVSDLFTQQEQVSTCSALKISKKITVYSQLGLQAGAHRASARRFFEQELKLGHTKLHGRG